MGKFSRWIRSFLTGKKQKDVEKCRRDDEPTSVVVVESPAAQVSWPPTTPKDKKRWSFGRPSASAACSGVRNATGTVVAASSPPLPAAIVSEKGKLRYDPSYAIRAAFEEAAATKIQAYYRSYLARKALCALRGIVKLQALVRGHLVRKQTSTAIRCMQTLLMVQSRARAQRFHLAGDGNHVHQRRSAHRRRTHRHLETDMGNGDRLNVVENNVSKCKADSKGRKRSPRYLQTEHEDTRFSTNPAAEEDDGYSRQDANQISPAPSVTYDASPRLCRGYLGEYPINTTPSRLQYVNTEPELVPPEILLTLQQARCAELLPNEYPFYPSYMANTTSSRAKARSHSAPNSRPDTFERQPSRRRMSVEGRNVPRSTRMQRSSSQVGSTVEEYQYPWWIKLDQSMVSLKDSECGSTSTFQTNTHYYRSVVGNDVVDGQRV